MNLGEQTAEVAVLCLHWRSAAHARTRKTKRVRIFTAFLVRMREREGKRSVRELLLDRG